jgi:hypothetical protein
MTKKSRFSKLSHPDTGSMKRETGMFLAGDIGGTKSRLAIFADDADPRRPLAEEVSRATAIRESNPWSARS